MILRKRIKIYRTQGEFDLLEEKIKQMGKPDLNCFLRGEIRKLEKKYTECPDCITHANGGKKKEKVHYLDESSYAVLVKISIVMKKPITSIIDDFIISPLLKPAI